MVGDLVQKKCIYYNDISCWTDKVEDNHSQYFNS